jgi:hypothetical protein
MLFQPLLQWVPGCALNDFTICVQHSQSKRSIVCLFYLFYYSDLVEINKWYRGWLNTRVYCGHHYLATGLASTPHLLTFRFCKDFSFHKFLFLEYHNLCTQFWCIIFSYKFCHIIFSYKFCHIIFKYKFASRKTCAYNLYAQLTEELSVFFYLTISCAHNYFCKRRVMCITYSIRTSCAHNFCIRKNIEDKT